MSALPPFRYDFGPPYRPFSGPTRTEASPSASDESARDSGEDLNNHSSDGPDGRPPVGSEGIQEDQTQTQPAAESVPRPLASLEEDIVSILTWTADAIYSFLPTLVADLTRPSIVTLLIIPVAWMSQRLVDVTLPIWQQFLRGLFATIHRQPAPGAQSTSILFPYQSLVVLIVDVLLIWWYSKLVGSLVLAALTLYVLSIFLYVCLILLRITE
ncbi:hypothetical protein F4780DRAFT_775579 [Xylariomycetidae sp. FL0641]|nr:hypothetical protein F4780DRAFT_775579 [Xylariomycetidae sp. FL0641]